VGRGPPAGDEGAGVLLVTHNVVEAERVVDSLVVLDRGAVVASGTPAQLRGADDRLLRLSCSWCPAARTRPSPGRLAPSWPCRSCDVSGTAAG
jgi:ABC-2 type transport system ATP-binding protein